MFALSLSTAGDSRLLEEDLFSSVWQRSSIPSPAAGDSNDRRQPLPPLEAWISWLCRPARGSNRAPGLQSLDGRFLRLQDRVLGVRQFGDFLALEMGSRVQEFSQVAVDDQLLRQVQFKVLEEQLSGDGTTLLGSGVWNSKEWLRGLLEQGILPSVSPIENNDELA